MKTATFLPPETVDTQDTVIALRAFIKTGNYRPGDRLPSERDLIVQLGISRSTLRKAFDALEHEGAIWRHVGKGTFIASDEPQDGNGALADLIQQVTPVTLMRARAALEPAIAREAAINAAEDSVTRLKTIRDRTVKPIERCQAWRRVEHRCAHVRSAGRKPYKFRGTRRHLVRDRRTRSICSANCNANPFGVRRQ